MEGRKTVDYRTGLATAREHAGLGIRLVAAIVDAIIVLVFLAFIGIVILLVDGRNAVEGNDLSGLGTLISCLTWVALIGYPVVTEVTMGGTVGKLVTGIEVRRVDGRRSGWDTAIVRTLLLVVDLFPYVIPGLVGMILIGTSPTKQRLGDRVAKTVVVKKSAASAPPMPTQRF